MPFDANSLPQYIENLLSGAEIPSEQREAIRKALASEDAIKKANELAVPRPDYHSSLDQQRSKFDTERALWTEKEKDYRTWYEQQRQRVAEWEASHSAGGGGGTGDGNNQPGGAVTAADLERLKKQWQEEMDQRFTKQGEAVLGVTEDYVSLVADYQDRFHKRLPVEEVRKKAIEEGVNLRVAYDRYIAPEVEKQRQEETDRKIKEAREEGFREAMTRSMNPAAPGGVDGHPVFRRSADLPPDYSKMTAEQKEAASQAAFEKHWTETQGFTKTN